MRNRSSRNWLNFGRAIAFAAFTWCAVAALVPAATNAAQSSYVDRRVGALPARALLHADPRTLIDPRRQAIAGTLGLYRRTLVLGWGVSEILAFWYLWGSGGAARLRDALRRRARNPIVLRFLCGAALALLAAAAAVPTSLAQYRVALVFDQTSETLGTWLLDGAIRVVFDAIAVGAIVAFVLTLVERSRLWWAYAIAVLVAVGLIGGFLEPVTFAPIFNRYVPLAANAPHAAALRALEQRAGVPNAPIYTADSSRQTQIPSARVAGFGPTARVILGDTQLAHASSGEIAYAAARQFDHYRHADALRTSFMWTLLFVASIVIGVVLADRIGFRGDDDPLSRLALVVALAGIAGLLAFPVYNGYSRHIERRADAFALGLTHDPASAVRAFVRAADRRFVSLCTSRPVELYFSASPNLGTRIAAATGRRDLCR